MPDLYLPPLCTIHPWSPEAMGPQMNAWNLDISTNLTSSIITNANVLMAFPFTLRVPAVIQKLFVYNGAVVSGHFDLGVYSADNTRMVSTGSITQSGTSALQSVSIAPTKIGPGCFWLAMVFDNTTATVFRRSSGQATQRFMGMVSQSSVFPLPATLVPATYLFSSPYFFGLTTRSLI